MASFHPQLECQLHVDSGGLRGMFAVAPPFFRTMPRPLVGVH